MASKKKKPDEKTYLASSGRYKTQVYQGFRWGYADERVMWERGTEAIRLTLVVRSAFNAYLNLYVANRNFQVHLRHHKECDESCPKRQLKGDYLVTATHRYERTVAMYKSFYLRIRGCLPGPVPALEERAGSTDFYRFYKPLVGLGYGIKQIPLEEAMGHVMCHSGPTKEKNAN